MKATSQTPAATVTVVDNYISGGFVPPSTNDYLDVINPADSKTIGRVGLSSKCDVDNAVQAAKAAFPSWASRTVKQRASIMMKFHALVQQHSQQMAELIVLENGKNITEALADVAKGNETVEWACGLPHASVGNTLRVSGLVSCTDRRDPLGVVASIVPFNFPFMVPMWTVPIALVMGNTVVLKPSEKVPLTMNYAADLFRQAGLPDGVFNMVQGTRTCVEALIDHQDVNAVTFVGSSPVAKAVAHRCRSLDEPKRCTALGGAKNHLVALEDCDTESAASDITVSFAGCAGQRCMAASVLLTVDKGGGDDDEDEETPFGEFLVDKIVSAASKIKAGSGPGELGPVIDQASYDKIISYIEHSEQMGAKVLLDGRGWKKDDGYWIGPTILKHSSREDKTIFEEVFGPVLSVFPVESWEEAIDIENSSPFGNAASIYTTHGGNAEWFTSRFNASMLGVNIGCVIWFVCHIICLLRCLEHSVTSLALLSKTHDFRHFIYLF
jgi:malonate-semialdehyde dehydrogenase (acetylating)/methylmalonate-semialdehyde dehydrogenase